MSQKLRILSAAVFMVACLTGDVLATNPAEQARPQNSVSRATADFVSAAKKHKESVQALIPFYEASLKTATEALEQRRELQAKGLIAKSELDTAERAITEAKTQLDQARQQLVESEQLIAEASAETARPALKFGAKGRYMATPAVMRYSGTGSWALTQASTVKDFFASKFGRQLPVSALGQSDTHNRLGFDHRNSVDVAVHPDSVQGKALIDYLRGNGIPFLAFRSAIRGVATGAHIHIGNPSHRL